MTQSVRIPAIVYRTSAANRYYGLSDTTEAIGFPLELSWSEEELTFPAGQGQAIYQRYRVPGRDPVFGNGRLWFYTFVKNTDPGPEGEPVKRLAILGLDSRGRFGFVKTVDYLGREFPQPAALGFQIFASGAGVYRHEVDIEAGSPAALF